MSGNPNAVYRYQHGQQVDRQTSASSDLGYRCVDVNGNTVDAAGQPVVITVTQQDFANLPVKAPAAHAGPPSGILPVHMDLILYTEPSTQELSTTLLGTPVAIRAIPTSYSWDFGDGNTLTTTHLGRPYPHKDLTHQYEHEGWYDVTLTTTFAGQYSVNGGPWQDIDGTITVPSAPVPIYSRSYESHLVDPNHPAAGDQQDDHGTEPAPPRTPENNGPPDPQPQDRRD